MNPKEEIGVPEKKLRFSQELQQVAEHFSGHPISLGDLLAATHGRGYDLMLVFITLPFLTPIPLPGLSTPFGLIVAFIGMRLALGREPWLPKKLLARKLPPRFFDKLLRAASRIVKWLEYLLKPRLRFVHERMVFRYVAGVLIMTSGLYLLMPLPVPFSNFLPAFTVMLLAAGALERDGLFFICGCVFFGITTAFFLLLGFGGAEVVDRLLHLATSG